MIVRGCVCAQQQNRADVFKPILSECQFTAGCSYSKQYVHVLACVLLLVVVSMARYVSTTVQLYNSVMGGVH